MRKLLAVLTLVAVLIISCSKEDSSEVKIDKLSNPISDNSSVANKKSFIPIGLNSNYSSFENQFFDLEIIEEIIGEFQNRDAEAPVIAGVIDLIGYPAWEMAITNSDISYYDWIAMVPFFKAEEESAGWVIATKLNGEVRFVLKSREDIMEAVSTNNFDYPMPVFALNVYLMEKYLYDRENEEILIYTENYNKLREKKNDSQVRSDDCMIPLTSLNGSSSPVMVDNGGDGGWYWDVIVTVTVNINVYCPEIPFGVDGEDPFQNDFPSITEDPSSGGGGNTFGNTDIIFETTLETVLHHCKVLEGNVHDIDPHIYEAQVALAEPYRAFCNSDLGKIFKCGVLGYSGLAKLRSMQGTPEGNEIISDIASSLDEEDCNPSPSQIAMLNFYIHHAADIDYNMRALAVRIWPYFENAGLNLSSIWQHVDWSECLDAPHIGLCAWQGYLESRADNLNLDDDMLEYLMDNPPVDGKIIVPTIDWSTSSESEKVNHVFKWYGFLNRFTNCGNVVNDQLNLTYDMDGLFFTNVAGTGSNYITSGEVTLKDANGNPYNLDVTWEWHTLLSQTFGWEIREIAGSAGSATNYWIAPFPNSPIMFQNSVFLFYINKDNSTDAYRHFRSCY